MKIANDIRLMASGPQAGLGELLLPAIQPGSSIMPGKVNPVISEVVIQVGAQVTGNCQAITIGGQWGQLDLNVMLPMMARNMLESVRLLANASRVFVDKALAGLKANREQAESYIEGSISMATALNPLIGYDNAAKIAKKSHATGRTVRELAYEESGLTREQVDEALHPHRQTEAGRGRVGEVQLGFPGRKGQHSQWSLSIGATSSAQTDSAARDELIDLLLLPDEWGKEAERRGSGGEDQDAALLQRPQRWGHPLLELDPDHHAPAANLADFGASDAREAIHQLRAEGL